MSTTVSFEFKEWIDLEMLYAENMAILNNLDDMLLEVDDPSMDVDWGEKSPQQSPEKTQEGGIEVPDAVQAVAAKGAREAKQGLSASVLKKAIQGGKLMLSFLMKLPGRVWKGTTFTLGQVKGMMVYIGKLLMELGKLAWQTLSLMMCAKARHPDQCQDKYDAVYKTMKNFGKGFGWTFPFGVAWPLGAEWLFHNLAPEMAHKLVWHTGLFADSMPEFLGGHHGLAISAVVLAATSWKIYGVYLHHLLEHKMEEVFDEHGIGEEAAEAMKGSILGLLPDFVREGAEKAHVKGKAKEAKMDMKQRLADPKSPEAMKQRKDAASALWNISPQGVAQRMNRGQS